MGITDYYKNGLTMSFEIFPPKTKEGEDKLFDELNILATYNPAFISVTYGAGGSTRDKTLDLAEKIRDKYVIDPLIHFTCVGANREEIREYIDKVSSMNFKNILALRGDPPKGEANFVPAKNGFNYVNELIEFIKSIDDFSIAVAGYPEKHPEASSLDEDIDNLKKKIDAGGEIIFTQLFFDNNAFLRYVEKARSKNIVVPIVPGIMPVTSESQIKRFTEMCGAAIPKKLSEKLEKCNNETDVCKIGIEYSIEQCNELLKNDIPGFHFYPLNKSEFVKTIIDNLDVKFL